MDEAPPALPVKPDGIPDELKKRPQWVLWRWTQRDGKWTKPPLQSNGAFAKSNDPSTWCTFEEAVSAYFNKNFSGIGFGLSQDDNLSVIDLDHCIDMSTGVVDPWAQEILDKFQGTYIEKSPSADGLHIWCHGAPGSIGVKKIPDTTRKQQIEVYKHPSNRYMTCTGAPL